jgi:hypothetical protein
MSTAAGGETLDRMKPTRGEQRRARRALLRQTVTVAFALLLAKVTH